MKPNKQFNRMMRKLKDDKKYHIFKDHLKEKQMIYLSSYSSYHLVSIFHPSLEKYINNLYKNISFLHNEKFLEKFGDYHASFSPSKTIEEIEEFCEFCDSYGILWRSHNRAIDFKKNFKNAVSLFFHAEESSIGYSDFDVADLSFKDFMEKYIELINNFENEI